jgi:NADH-quinone oxidoreductase subunit L
MIFGLGIGAFTAAMFHLTTHAFFKALLFLGAGSVIHGTGTQNIWEMGGLRTRMRTTFLTFGVGYLALAGIPPLAGFWSKDAILDHAFHADPLLWVLGLVGAFLTAFYMTRLMQVVFGGEWRGGAGSHGEPHESPAVMTGPLVVLAVLAAVAGWVGTPFANQFGHFVFAGAHLPADHVTPQVLGLMGLSTAVALAGIGLGVYLYPGGRFRLSHLAGSAPANALHRWSLDKLYFDELYWRAIVVPLLWITRLAALIDRRLIDGIVNGVGWVTVLLAHVQRLVDVYVVDLIVNLAGWIPKQVGRSLRCLQTGQVQSYLLGLCLGAIVLFWLFLRVS